MTKPPFAFFDFDGTLTHSDTVIPFLRHCFNNDIQFIAKLLPLFPKLTGYLCGIISNKEAKESICQAYLRNWHQEDIKKQAILFSEKILPNLLLDKGMQKLIEHQKQGDRCVLVSASPDWYLIPWARQHKLYGVIGTRMAYTENGMINGKINGQNCYGMEKVRRIEDLYGIDCWLNSYAYSDSKTDLPMLKHAKHGYLLKRKGLFQKEFISITN